MSFNNICDKNDTDNNNIINKDNNNNAKDNNNNAKDYSYINNNS